MYNDISARLLRAFAGRWVDRAETDTKRSMRKLAEYGLSFSSGSLKNFFLQARDILNDNRSPYYRLASEFIANTDKQRISEFGICFGYYGFAREKKKIPNKLAVAVNGAEVPEPAALHQKLAEWDAHEAAICYLFCEGTEPSAGELLAEVALWPKRAFLIFADDPEALKYSWPQNVMLLVNVDAPDFAAQTQALNEQRLLSGAWHRFDDANAAETMSDAYLDSIHAAGVNFLLLLKGPDCTEECRRRVNDFCYKDKRKPHRPLFVAELFGDLASMNEWQSV